MDPLTGVGFQSGSDWGGGAGGVVVAIANNEGKKGKEQMSEERGEGRSNGRKGNERREGESDSQDG